MAHPAWAILLLVPSVAVYAVQYAVGIKKEAGKDVAFRPPAWAFGVAWAMLLLSMGIAWVMEGEKAVLVHVLFTLLTLSLCLWIVMYRVSPTKAAVWVLVASIGLCAMCICACDEKASRILLCPLITWLVFATLLNTTESTLKALEGASSPT